MISNSSLKLSSSLYRSNLCRSIPYQRVLFSSKSSSTQFQSDKSFNNNKPSNQSSNDTYFGFQQVQENERQTLVNKVFANVAPSYDVMNDLMSTGLHRLWKDAVIQCIHPRVNGSYLDVAGGTGDVAFRIIESLKQNQGQLYGQNNSSSVTVCDINPAMLSVGEQRANKFGYIDSLEYIEKKSNMNHDNIEGIQPPLDRSYHHDNINVRFLEGNAENLDKIESNSQDAYTICFGIRNCTHIDKVLEDAYRVLKPGGQFLCLEFSKVDNPVLRQIYDLYSFNVIPLMGQIIAQDRDSYQYLVESIRKFPTQENFKKMIETAGFKDVRYTNLTFGVCAIHQGFKL